MFVNICASIIIPKFFTVQSVGNDNTFFSSADKIYVYEYPLCLLNPTLHNPQKSSLYFLTTAA
jgi:hypothetical protein